MFFFLNFASTVRTVLCKIPRKLAISEILCHGMVIVTEITLFPILMFDINIVHLHLHDFMHCSAVSLACTLLLIKWSLNVFCLFTESMELFVPNVFTNRHIGTELTLRCLNLLKPM